VAAQHFRYAYLAPLDNVQNDAEPTRRRAKESVLATGFIITAFLMAVVLGGFLFHPSAITPKSSIGHSVRSFFILLAGYAAAFLIFVSINSSFTKKPSRAVFLSLSAFLILVAAAWATDAYQPTSSLTMFFFFIGWQSVFVKDFQSPLRFATDFRNWALILLLFWIYISEVFSNIPPRWGGGQPTPVQIFQNTQASWSQSNPTDALLLDETDQGFYVLLSEHGKAFFIPRSNVSSILFGSKEDLPKKP
jgi:hypothetical protein